MATLEDIARVLGVTKGTVSKALNGAVDVSEAMRRSVVETAVELGYTRPRRGDDAPRIAVFITNMAYARPEDFGYDILVGFRKMAEPAGYRVQVIPLSIELEETIPYEQYMMREHYLGALFLGLSLRDPWLRDFETCTSPTVLYDNHVTGNPRVTYVGADNGEGLRLAVQYLKGLNHRNIGYLSSALGAYVYRQRYDAFFQAMRDNHLPCGRKQARNSFHQHICLDEHLPALLKQGCTAILCSHDTLACAVLERCREQGIRVPEDVSVLGFDDLPLCETCRPPLTTIRQDRTELGKSAYYALASQIRQIHISSLKLHPEVILRGSVGPAPDVSSEL